MLSKEKKNDRQRLVDTLDRVFARYIKLLRADTYGMCTCISCPTRRPRQEMDCAHHQGRAKMMTRWYPPNCRVACPECNTARPEQHQKIFKKRLIEEHGQQRYDDLIELSNQIAERSAEEMLLMIKEYRKKIHILEKRLT